MKNKITTSLIFLCLLILVPHRAAFTGSWLSPVQLTHNTTSDQVSVINADGTRIAYDGSDDGDDDIYVLVHAGRSWQQSQKLTFNATPDTMRSINNKMGDV